MDLRHSTNFYLCKLLLVVFCLLQPGWFLAAEEAAAPEKPSYTNEELLTQMVIVDVSEQTLENIPALAVIFSQDMDPVAEFDSFLTVTQEGKAVQGGWVLTGNSRRLYFTNIQPNSKYRVQIRPGIAAKNGLKLQKPGDYTVETRDIQPAFDFATKGSILPARLTNGLPVRVVNVPELDVEFLRVQPDKLGDVLKSLRLEGGVQSWELDEVHASTESVYTNRYVTDAKKNARETRVLPVESIKELQQPGLYFAIMRQPGRFSDSAYRITHFVVTNLGLHVRLYPKRLEVFVNALDSGKPVSGVQMHLQSPKEGLDAQTDGGGRVSFAQRPEGDLFLTAMLDGQFAFLDLREAALDLSDYPVTGQPDKALSPFIYSPRDLYRPGEAVDLSIFLRNRDGQVEPVNKLNLRLVRPDTKLLREETLTVTQADLGYFADHFTIPADAPTGVWRAEVRLGNQDESPLQVFSFHVEEFMPERMKLALSANDSLLLRGEKLVVSVQGDYLYGAPAAGNTLKTTRSLRLDRQPLPAFKDYYFGNPDDEKRLENDELPDLVLNEQGAGFIEVPAIADTIGSPLTVKLAASLQEPGGRVVTRNLSESFWPAQQLVGIRPLFANGTVDADTDAKFELVKVDHDGKKLGSTSLSATLVREEYEYFWEYSESEGWRREETKSEYPLTQQKFEILANSTGQLVFPVSYGRYRLEVEDADTQLKTVYPFSAGWQGGSDQLATRPDQIELTLDKAAYQAGDVAKLTVNAPAAGDAMIAVEGDELLWMDRVSLPEGKSTLDIPVEKAWNRHDLYLSVTAFRPADSKAKISPNRAIGLIPMPLDRSERKLALSIEAPEKVIPEQTIKVQIKAEGLRSQEAVVTLAAVDVGVLNITRFKTPDPFAFYFSQHAYAVDLHDDYGKIIESVEGASLRQRFGGGDGDAGGPRPQADVQIVSLFNGAVAFDDKGVAEIELPLPGFDGRLRLMAVAMGEEQMGSAEREMQVASPVVASLSGPRFLAAGDTSFLTVELNNTSDAQQTVSLKVSANKLLDLVATEKDYTLDKGQRELLKLPFAAQQDFGVGEVSLNLTGKDFVANRQLKMALRPAYPAAHKQLQFEVSKDKPLELPSSLVEPYMPATLKARLTVSNTPPLPVASAIQGLLQYPYGCLEQTTSSAYPYLFLEAEQTEKWGLPPISMEERNRRVQESIVRLSGMQLSNGAFTLWGSYGPDEYWLTPYVADFLLDARKQGFVVPDKLLQTTLKNLEERLQEGYSQPSGRYGYADNPEHMDFATRAYAAYVLAREKRAILGTLRAIYEKDANKAITGLPLVQLGLALVMQGDKRRGEEAIMKGLNLPRKADLYLGDYGSPIRDRAMMLYLLLVNEQSVPALGQHIQYLARDIYARSYLSTQEQVYIFLLGKVLDKQASEQWQAELSVDGNALPLAQAGSFTRTLGADDFAKGLKITAKGETPLYVGLTLDAYPLKAPAVREEPVSVQRQWFDLKGNEVKAAAIKAGDLLLTRLTVFSTEQVRDALAVDLLPSGFEIENSNLLDNEALQSVKLDGMDTSVAEWMSSNPVQHEEFRDDRYIAAFELNAKANRYLFYLVRVVSAGKFVLPPPYVTDMYRPDIYGIGQAPGELLITR